MNKESRFICALCTLVILNTLYTGTIIEKQYENTVMETVTETTSSDDYDSLHAGRIIDEEQDIIEGMNRIPIWVSALYGDYYLTEENRRCTLIINGEEDVYSLTVQSVSYQPNGNIEFCEFSCENGVRTASDVFIFENFVNGTVLEVEPFELSSIVVRQTKGKECYVTGIYERASSIEEEN